MADDVWAALVNGVLGFAHSRAGDLIDKSFSDTGKLASSLVDGSKPGTFKTKFETLKQDITDLSAIGTAVQQAIQPQIDKAKTAIQQMATELGTSPFTIEAAGRAAVDLADVLEAWDTALSLVADELAKQEPAGGPNHDKNVSDLKDAINGIDQPWKKPFENLAADVTKTFDAICKLVLGKDNASKDVGDNLKWDKAGKKLTWTFDAVGQKQLGAVSFDGASLVAFFTFATKATIGITLKTKLKAGLRGDKLLEKIIPREATTADAEPTAITLDSDKGLTFGDGKDQKIILPVRFSSPGIELREFAIALPEGDQKNGGRIDVMTTIAGKIGDVLGVVAEGGGVSIKWVDGGNLEVLPKPPYSTGIRVNAGPVKGGGFLRFNEAKHEYGGILDLQFSKIGITAIGLIATDPFSFVIVIGVHFLPKIELSFGFTLNGLGGILAVERAINVDVLNAGLKDGIIGKLLFPEDPVASAPTILDALGSVFPPQSGGFVVGPIAELGWGSQAGFVKAKLGLVLALPDPKIVLLGVLQIGVPSADVDPKLRIVDINAELLGEFTTDFFFITIGLAPSKLAKLTISGDIGILVRWSGGSALAVSIGGFFPKYTPPPELTGLRRIAIEMSPPVKILTVRAEAYFAITSNTIQFGGKVTVDADLGPVSANAHISVDALFQWSPKIYFIFIVDAGIVVKAFGATVAGVSFHGELRGTHPWHLEGTASVDILFWTAHADIGPIEWGEQEPTVTVPISPVQTVHEALSSPAAWKPLLPAGADMLARFIPSDLPLLLHPLGSLELKQLSVPLETKIDRIGSSPVTSPSVSLTNPKIGSGDAGAVWHSIDAFSPGHFINLTADQQAARPDFESFPSGMRVAASDFPLSGATAIATAYEWDTVYPGQSFERHFGRFNLDQNAHIALRTSPVGVAARDRNNAYMPVVRPAAPTGVVLRDIGLRSVVSQDNLTPALDVSSNITTTAAEQFIAEASSAQSLKFQSVAIGVSL